MSETYIMYVGEDLIIGEIKRPKSVVVVTDKKAIRYVEERTCQQVDVTKKHLPYVTHMIACSLCGTTLAIDEYPAPNYCPSCGAKVANHA